MRCQPHMIPIEINIAKGIQRWLERPENEAWLREFMAQTEYSNAQVLAKRTFVEMQGAEWLGDRVSNPYMTFVWSSIRLWIFYHYGTFHTKPEIEAGYHA